MAIAITLSAAAGLETYDGLKAFLVAHLELDPETESQLPNLIRMAEYRLDRMVTIPQRETSASLSFTAGASYASLPADFRHARLVRESAGVPLEAVSLADLRGYGAESGVPVAYAVANQALHVAPAPGSAMTLEVVYTAKLTPLTDDNQTNWLLTENADAYVYAALIQCEAFLGKDDRLPLLESALVQAMEEINRQGNRYRSGSPLVMRAARVA